MLVLVGTGIDHSVIKEKLTAAGIAFQEAAVKQPREAAGIAFSEERRHEVIEILGLGDKKFFESATDQEDIRILIYGCDVSHESWNGKGDPEKFTEVAKEILLASVLRDIVISVPHKKNESIPEDGKLHIFIWSSPEGRADTRPPSMLWGLAVDCRDEAFMPSGQGETIFDSSGWPVAEIVNGKAIYIHYDICHHGTDNELKIFACVCQAAVFCLQRTVEFPGEEKTQKQRILENSRIFYIDLCSKRFRPSISNIQESIGKNEQIIRDAQVAIAKAVREIAECKRKVEEAPKAPEADRESFGAEFDRLCDVEGVESVQVMPGMIMVFTETIIMPFHGVKYEIGKFRIDISLGEYDFGKIRCYNLSRVIVRRWFHPNIQTSGDVCFGNISTKLGDTIGKYELAVVVHLVIQYLKYVSPKGWDYDITKWPVAEGNIAANFANYARRAVRGTRA